MNTTIGFELDLLFDFPAQQLDNIYICLYKMKGEIPSLVDRLPEIVVQSNNNIFIWGTEYIGGTEKATTRWG